MDKIKYKKIAGLIVTAVLGTGLFISEPIIGEANMAPLPEEFQNNGGYGGYGRYGAYGGYGYGQNGNMYNYMKGMGTPCFSPKGVTNKVKYFQTFDGDKDYEPTIMCISSTNEPIVNEKNTVICYPVSKKKGTKVVGRSMIGLSSTMMYQVTYTKTGEEQMAIPYYVEYTKGTGEKDENGKEKTEVKKDNGVIIITSDVYDGKTSLVNDDEGTDEGSFVEGYALAEDPIINDGSFWGIGKDEMFGDSGIIPPQQGDGRDWSGVTDDGNNDDSRDWSGIIGDLNEGNNGNDGNQWGGLAEELGRINDSGQAGNQNTPTVNPADYTTNECKANPNSDACMTSTCDIYGWNSGTCKSVICNSGYRNQYEDFCITPSTEDICVVNPSAEGCANVSDYCMSNPDSMDCKKSVSDVCIDDPSLSICKPTESLNAIEPVESGYDYGKLMNDILGDGENSYNAGDGDWATSEGVTDGYDNLDDYFGNDDGQELPMDEGITSDVMGFPEEEGVDVEFPYEVDENGEYVNVGDDETVYEDSYPVDEIAGGEVYDNNGSVPQENKTLGDIFSDTVKDLDGSLNSDGAGLLGLIGGKDSKGKSLEDKLKAISYDFGATTNPSKNVGEQELFEMAQKLLLATGYSEEDLKKGRNYDVNSAFTEPTHAWDFNRITTLMQKKSISWVSGNNGNLSTPDGKKNLLNKQAEANKKKKK